MRSVRVISLIIICAFIISIASFSTAAESSAAILGDADGDGTVDILDVTLILRVLARLADDPSGMIAKRGDVDNSGELETTDATWIQRHLAKISVPYPVGEPIAEPQPPTQKNNDYELPIV